MKEDPAWRRQAEPHFLPSTSPVACPQETRFRVLLDPQAPMGQSLHPTHTGGVGRGGWQVARVQSLATNTKSCPGSQGKGDPDCK